MAHWVNIGCLLLFIFWLSGCSSIKPYYAIPSGDGLSNPLPADDPMHTVYLTGEFDGGDSLSFFEQKFFANLKADQTDKTLVFLGNVIPHPSAEMEVSVQRIKTYADRMRPLIADAEVKTYWIPGNREWRNDQRFAYEHVKAVESILEAYFGNNVFLPSNGCGEPVRIELAEGLQLILLDSEWWLHSKQNENAVLNDCELLDQEEILANLEGYLARHKNDQMIIAAHHPLYDNGVNGGNFPAKDHLFPFSRVHRKLMIPVPFAGSVLSGVSKAIGARQQFSHPLNQAYRRSLINIFANYDDLIVASAHEQNLQYFEVDGNHFLVSGGGMEADYVRRRNKAAFTFQQTGFTRISYYENGAVWMEQFAWINGEFRPMLRVQIRAERAEKMRFEVQLDPEDAPTFIDTMASNNYDAVKSWKFFFGEHFRDEWKTTVRFPVVFLDTLKGGLTPIRQGGGFQTKSLRLVDQNGRQYVLRSINKDASKVVPSFLRGTFADVV
ncbi:MAG: metallophosphoesterase, partial [Bacteroidota bacterium]